ncbi:MAG: hypothetical protein V1895_03475 [Parcubacteria group bacterium]
MATNKETRLLGTILERLNGREDDRWYRIYNAVTNQPRIMAQVEAALGMLGYLSRLIVACNFWSVCEGITEAHYPPPDKPVSDKLEYVEHEISEPMNRAEIGDDMAQQDLRIASPYELLAYAAKNPKAGTKTRLIALGQYWQVPHFLDTLSR